MHDNFDAMSAMSRLRQQRAARIAEIQKIAWAKARDKTTRGTTMKKPLKIWQTKTFVAGAVGVLAAVGTYAAGEVTLGQAINIAITSVIGVLLRQGIITK